MKSATKSAKKTSATGRVGRRKGDGLVRVAFVVPHLYICDALRGKVIFSPGELARDLVGGLARWGDGGVTRGDVEVTLWTPGAVKVFGADGALVRNETADWSGLESELDARGYGLLTFAAKHPALFVAMARQLQAEIISEAYAAANRGEYDVVHIYTNEEDLALQFANLCNKPVLFTHHDPYNFLIKYKSVFPRYKHHNFISTSIVQQETAPAGTNFVANIYHGVSENDYKPSFNRGRYLLYLGRIVAEKGVEIAVKAARKANLPLKIMGKYYQDGYFGAEIEPFLGDDVEYVGFLQGEEKLELIRGAVATVVPSRFMEPFGMVAIESLALGTPVIASKNGALPEIVGKRGGGSRGGGGSRKGGCPVECGYLIDVAREVDEKKDEKSIDALARVMGEVWRMDDRATDAKRRAARADFEERWTLEKMVDAHAELYLRYARNCARSDHSDTLD
ncbi:glycosyltransferase [Candidatus Saccharibacteria bacterium]|nr:glycosyltransferase [Candidatus Saccharibacteria bacterium]